jgi:hypothetical protein
VAGVVATLEAHDRIGPLGEQVGDLALSLIAPLGAHDHDSRHGTQSSRGASTDTVMHRRDAILNAREPGGEERRRAQGAV